MSQIATVDNGAPIPMPGRLGQGTAVEMSRAVAEVQAAIVVAQQVPRSIGAARTDMEQSCGMKALAERAFYRFPRGGQTVQGPSVYLARELARCWRNIQYGLIELRRDDEYHQSEMQAWAWDVQTNARASHTFIVPHKRDKRGGAEPLVDLRDIYENNANQGARRLREAIFAILPPWFVEEAKDLCYATLEGGDGKPVEQRIAGAIKAFDALGVTQDRLEQKLGRSSDRWTGYDIAQLLITHRSIVRREIAVEDEFPQPRVTVDEIEAASPPPAQAGNGQATPAAEPPADLITSAQSRKLHALLREVHDAAGDDRFPILSAAVGREVTSTSELSKAEASSIIDALEGEKAADNGPREYADDDPERPM